MFPAYSVKARHSSCNTRYSIQHNTRLLARRQTTVDMDPVTPERTWWRLSVMEKWVFTNVRQCQTRHSRPIFRRVYMGVSDTSPKLGFLCDGPYRPQKWSGLDPRFGFKSAPLLRVKRIVWRL